MRLQGRELVEGLAGDDVADLHDELTRLGWQVDEGERERRHFGKSTLAAVVALQERVRIEPTGVVDERTAHRLGEELSGGGGKGGRGGEVGVVRGTARTPDRAPVGGVTIVAYDVGLRGEELLGEVMAADDGGFYLEYTRPPRRAGNASAQPDIRVAAAREGVEVGSSPVAYNAPRELEVAVDVPEASVDARPEFLRVVAAISPLVDEAGLRSAAELRETESRHITYLANKTGWDARAVAMVVAAERMANDTGVPGELFYALFRAGLPADRAALGRLSSAAVKNVWLTSMQRGLISTEHEDALEAHAVRFTAVGAETVLAADPQIGVSSFDAVLEAAGLEGEQKVAVATMYAEAPTVEAFWETARDRLGDEVAAGLSTVGKLAYLTVNNAPLIRTLTSRVGVADPIALIQEGFYEPAAWQPLLADAPVPPEVPSGTDESRRAAYAELLSAQLTLSYPTAVVGSMIERGTLAIGGDALVREVSGFLLEHQGRFELGATPVARYLDTSGTELSTEAVGAVKVLQRQYQMSTSDSTMRVLADSKLDSAFAITRYDQPTFVAMYAEPMGGEANARTIYSKAEQIHNAVLNVASTYLLGRMNPDIYAVPRPTREEEPDETHADMIAYATLEQLFGELDYCACDHCRSVLSPAAYLVDLLTFIDHRKLNAAGEELPMDIEKDNPVDVLLSRRPDIAHLQLTCENSNTALPYVDLVNEILEHYVVHTTLAAFTGYDTGPDDTSEDLVASPRNILPEAYTLLSEQSYPLGLPFHRPLTALRAYMERFDTTLGEAMEALRRNDDIDAPDPTTGYGWRDILLEQLGISRQAHRLLTASDVILAELYGFPAGTSDDDVMASVSNAKTFARTMAITYEEVVDVIRTSFVNEAGWLLTLLDHLGISFATIEDFHAGTIDAAQLLQRVGDVDPAPYGGDIPGWVSAHYAEITSLITLTDADGNEDLCSFEALELRRAFSPPSQRITPIDALRLVRFVRLWRSLGLSIDHTDKVIAALFPAEMQPDAADDAATARAKLDAGMATLLLRFAHLRQLMDALDVTPKRDLLRVLSVWSEIDTVGPKSLYRQLFLSPSIERDDAFLEDGSGSVLAGGARLLEHLSTLRAAFNLRDADLADLVDELGFDAQTELTLENVGHLHRRAYLARKLKVSIRELRALVQMLGLDPYAAPAPPRAAAVDLVLRARALREAGLTAPLLMHLVRHDLPRGAPDAAAVLDAARTLHAQLVRIEREHVVVDDPNGDVAKAKMALVYGHDAADTFFGLLTGVARFEVSYAQASPALDPALTALLPTLGYDHLRKRLTNAGVMTETQRDALLAAGQPAPFNTALAALHVAGQSAAADFFTKYPDLATLHGAVTALPVAERAAAILAHFLPSLRRELQELYVLHSLAAESGLTPAEVSALVDDTRAVHASGDPATPAMADFLAAGQSGASMQVHFGPDVNTPANAVEPVVASLAYGADNPLPTDPANPANPVSGIWRWYVDPQAGGFYIFTVEADAASTVDMTRDGIAVALLADSGTWQTQEAIELQAGRLYRFELTVRNVHDRMNVLWESLGVAKATIPTEHLRPARSAERFSAAYARMLKVFELAEVLELDGAELAWFATRASLTIGSAGWLNAFPITLGGAPSPAVQKELVRRLEKLARYTELRRVLKAGDGRLLGVIDEPSRALEDGTPARASVTGWEETALTASLALLGQPEAALVDVDVVERVRTIIELSRSTGVPVGILSANVRNDPTHENVTTVQDALRSRYDTGAWADVIRPINDELRDAQRDALVAFVLHRLAGDPATSHIDTPEKLFEYFLVDVEMEPCMLTSRIRNALSAVQLFIQRCLLNLETRVAASSINSARWNWMKRYRMWEANRKVFLFPENWLEPELRDDKSPLFRDLESQLLEADVTEDAAGRAMGNYLKGLAEVAKLDVCGMFVEQNDGGTPADDIVHVVARTAGARHKYFYRRLRRASWTPWEPVGVDIEDTPLIPVVWKGRVFLFWLRLLHEATPTSGATTGPDEALVNVSTSELRTSVANRSVRGVLEWSELVDGQWQPVLGSDINDPVTVASALGAEALDRSAIRLSSSERRDGSLVITVDNGTSTPSFLLYNTHSLPVVDTGGIVIPDSAKATGIVVVNTMVSSRTIHAGSGLSATYTDFGHLFIGVSYTHDVLGSGAWDQVVEPRHALVDSFMAPFFYFDRRHAFYVVPRQSIVRVPDFSGVGFVPYMPDVDVLVEPPDLRLIPEPRLEDIIPELDRPYPPDPYRGVFDPSPIETFLRESNIRVAIDAAGTFALDDAVFSPLGSVELPERTIHQ